MLMCLSMSTTSTEGMVYIVTSNNNPVYKFLLLIINLLKNEILIYPSSVQLVLE